jgi:hypothetical protein
MYAAAGHPASAHMLRHVPQRIPLGTYLKPPGYTVACGPATCQHLRYLPIEEKPDTGPQVFLSLAL